MPPVLTAICWIALFLLTPKVLLWLEPRVKLIKWLSPAFFTYAVGIAAGNIVKPPSAVVEPFLAATVLIAIPLLLFPTDLRSWIKAAPRTLFSFGLWVAILLVVTTLAAHFWAPFITIPNERAGMAAAVYSGGTANLGAVHLALGLPGPILAELTLSDLMAGGLFLMFALSALPPLLRRWLPGSESDAPVAHSETTETDDLLPWYRRIAAWQAWVAMLAVIALSVGISFLFLGKTEEIVVVVSITLLSLAFSLIPPVRQARFSYENGEYLFMSFCVATGTLVDAHMMLEGGPLAVGFMMTCAYATALLFFLAARFFRIDADTALITTTAGIFGPPFIGPVAAALHNRKVVAPGMIMAIIGLALGNLIGLMGYQLAAWWG